MTSTINRAAFVFVLSLLLIATNALAQNSSYLSERIYGGATSSATKSIGVLIEGDHVHNYVYMCSGTFISPTHFLSAKHCVANNGFKNPYFIIIDSNFSSSIKVIAKVSSRTDDLAILTTRPTNVSPVPILISHSPNIGDVVQIFGYGRDQYQKAAFEPGSSHLLKYGIADLTSTSPYILSFINSASGGACHGDSGGPMIAVNQDGRPGIVGIASYGQGNTTSCAIGTKSSYVNLQSARALSFIDRWAPEAVVN
jgi:secreted trypsin-like serine protease